MHNPNSWTSKGIVEQVLLSLDLLLWEKMKDQTPESHHTSISVLSVFKS